MRRRSVVNKIALGSTVLGAGALGVAVTAGDAEARLDVYVDKSAQQLSVIKNGELLYVWPISTGRDPYSTPNGVYAPERLERSWFSRSYYNSPMPHAIFFHKGYAIHGSYDIMQLGGPASHGCVRLHPADAAVLFSMVEREGPADTAIFVGGDSSGLPYQDRAAYLPEPAPPPRNAGADRYSEAYPPPPGPPMSPYYRGYVDGRGAYPPGSDAAPYYQSDRRDSDRRDSGRYGDGPHPLRNPPAGPYGDGAPYADGRSAPRSPYIPPDYNTGRYADGRGAPRDPRTPPPDYRGDRYADSHAYGPPPDYDPYLDPRSAPRGEPRAPYYLPDRHGERAGDMRAADPHGPRVPPSAADRPADGPDRHHGEQLAARGHPAAAPGPALRPDDSATGERTPRHGVQPLAAGSRPNQGSSGQRAVPATGVATRPAASRQAVRPDAGAAPGRRQAPAGQTARTPAPFSPTPQPAAAAPPAAPPAARMQPERIQAERPQAERLPPQERSQAEMGYRVLPPSYWAGASWRWRRRDDDGPQEPPR